MGKKIKARNIVIFSALITINNYLPLGIGIIMVITIVFMFVRFGIYKANNF